MKFLSVLWVCRWSLIELFVGWTDLQISHWKYGTPSIVWVWYFVRISSFEASLRGLAESLAPAVLVLGVLLLARVVFLLGFARAVLLSLESGSFWSKNKFSFMEKSCHGENSLQSSELSSIFTWTISLCSIRGYSDASSLMETNEEASSPRCFLINSPLIVLAIVWCSSNRFTLVKQFWHITAFLNTFSGTL